MQANSCFHTKSIARCASCFVFPAIAHVRFETLLARGANRRGPNVFGPGGTRNVSRAARTFPAGPETFRARGERFAWGSANTKGLPRPRNPRGARKPGYTGLGRDRARTPHDRRRPERTRTRCISRETGSILGLVCARGRPAWRGGPPRSPEVRFLRSSAAKSCYFSDD